MARMILIVNATQVITSENNPNGIFSIVSGFPKIFDSGVNGNIEQNMKNAKAAYYSQLSTIYGNTNASKILMTVTLEAIDGKQILHESVGGFPAEEPVAQEEPTP